MPAGKVIVYGGRGALGATIVKHFKSKDWWVGNIDLISNEEADSNITINKDTSLVAQSELVMSELSKILENNKVDAILNVAGGWSGGDINNADLEKNIELMWHQSVWSSAIAAKASGKFLKEGGLLSLPGAQPALEGTPTMAAYGMAKAAVHQLTKSLGKEKSGLPKGVTAIALLPVTLDTPMNRKFMSKDGQGKPNWTSLEYVAELFMKWTLNEDRPKSGSLVQLITKDNVTQLVIT